MTFKFLWEIVELTLIVLCLYLALGVYVRRKLPTWSEPLERRRLAIVWALVVVVLAIKVTEDVIAGESGPIDRAILIFIQGHVPDALANVFEAITLTGSAIVLVPAASVATIALLAGRRRFEAVLLVASTVSGACVVYLVKTLVGRARPDLWQAQWYWGSSFPSGHTLVVAAFATASALSLARIWPSTREWAVIVAFLWILLVAMSRLVLGVHWPTDVLAASCIGATLPLALSLAFDSIRR